VCELTVDIEKVLEEMKPIIDETIEKFIPRKYDENFLKFMLGKARYKYNIESINEAVSDPVWNYLDRGGKRWRPALFLLIYEALGGKRGDVLDFVVLPELIHNATIIHDDIEDRSEERRGKPALHLVFGLDVANNVGDILYFLPFLSLMKNKHKFSNETILKAYETCTQELIKVGTGQATDISWHRGMSNANEITEEEYLQMVANKTGCNPRMGARLASIFAGKSEEEIESLGKFGETIGLAFQIQDDILNLTGEEFATRKGGLGEDVTEGKRSLLVVHTLQKASPEDRKRLLEILGMHTSNQKLRDEAIKIIKKYGSIEYAKEKAKNLVKEAWDDAEKIIPESEAKEKLKAFAYYLIERKI